MTNIDIKPHSVLLFQGDSITDAGRSRAAVGPNSPSGLGSGYPYLVADQLLKRYPDHHLQIYNRGVSGDRIQDLSQRWEQDSLRLLPDLISILIGVNDTWNYLLMGIGSSPEGFLNIYRQLLQNTLRELPDVRLVLCEPFVLLTGEVTEEWQRDIASRQSAVEKLAREFEAVFVPFQSALTEAAASGTPAPQLLEDGVHPTPRGHQVLTDCWLKAVLG